MGPLHLHSFGPAGSPPAGLSTQLVPATKADPDTRRAARGDDLTVAPVDSGHMVFLGRTGEVAGLIRAFPT